MSNRKGNAREVKKIEGSGFGFNSETKVWENGEASLTLIKKEFVCEVGGEKQTFDNLDVALSFIIKDAHVEIVSESEVEDSTDEYEIVLGSYELGEEGEGVNILVAGYDIETVVLTVGNRSADICNAILNISTNTELIEGEVEIMEDSLSILERETRKLLKKDMVSQENVDGLIATAHKNFIKSIEEYVPVEKPRTFKMHIGEYVVEIPTVTNFSDVRRCLVEGINYIVLNADEVIDGDTEFAKDVVKYILSLEREFTFMKIPVFQLQEIKYSDWLQWSAICITKVDNYTAGLVTKKQA